MIIKICLLNTDRLHSRGNNYCVVTQHQISHLKAWSLSGRGKRGLDPMLNPAGVISHLPARIWQCCAQGFAQKTSLSSLFRGPIGPWLSLTQQEMQAKLLSDVMHLSMFSLRGGVAGLPQGIRQF